MEFKKVDNSNYLLLIDNKEIGKCVFFNNDDDNLYLEVYKEFQGLGYGNLFFKEIVNLYKNENKNMYLKCDKNNYKMIKIIGNNNGIEIYRNNGIVFYVIEK